MSWESTIVYAVYVLLGAATTLALIFNLQRAIRLKRRPLGWRKIIRDYTHPNPEKPIRIGRQGWIVPVLERVFRYLRILTVSQLFQIGSRTFHTGNALLSERDRFKGIRTYQEITIDSYVVVVAIALGSLWAFGTAGYSTANLVIALFFLWELIVSTVNVVIFDAIRRDRNTASSARSLFLGLLNWLQVIFVFALIDMAATSADRINALWNSIRTAALIGDRGNADYWYIDAAQLAVTLWLILILFGWILGGMPSRRNKS